jgi:acetyl-CoA acetyltransferase
MNGKKKLNLTSKKEMKDLERELLKAFGQDLFLKLAECNGCNSSQMSDGAAFVLVMSEEMVKELNLEPIARLVNCICRVEPRIMGIGPVKVPKVLKQKMISA